MKIFTLAFMGPLLSSLLCAGELKPVLHASFDKDFQAESSKGTVAGKHSSQLTMETLSMLLHNGVKGKAAKIGAQTLNGVTEAYCVHFPGSFLNTGNGTISFWLKPLNWDFKDAKFHIFCEAYGPNSWLVIYKYSDSHNLYFLYGQDGNKRGINWVIAEAGVGKWERGEARFITASWDKTNIRLYIDGILQKVEKTAALPQSFDLLSAGPRSADAWKNHDGESLMDDLQVFDRVLTGPEVEELYASYGVKQIDKSKIPVKIPLVRMISSPDGQFLKLNFNLTRTMQKRTGFPVKMKVIRNGTEQVLEKILTADGTEYHYDFRKADLAKGDYQISLCPMRELPTDQIENNSFFFSVGDPEPIVDHSVPPPWSPVILSEKGGLRTIETKMQKTVFENNVFPSQMYSQTIPLLRAPMEFICNGMAVKGCSENKTLEQEKDQCVLVNTASEENFELKSKCRMEFDGMMWFDVTLTPKGNLTVDSAKIVIPLRPEVSSLYNCFSKDYFEFRGFYAGELKTSVRRNHYDHTHLPVIWVGNEQRGLYYFTQDQAGRRLRNRAETIRLDPGADGALLTINLIDYTLNLEKPVTWSFGLQVTPMKPFVRNRLVWRPEQNCGLWFPWEKIHNVPDARFKKDDYEKKRAAYSRNETIPLFHYFAGFSASSENPGYPEHAYDWSVTPPIVGTEVEPNSREWSYVFVCPQSQTYRDTYARNMEKCIRDLKMKYLYFDNCWSWYCTNETHGCGWRDEFGKLYPSANILGNREMTKNVYRAHKKLFPDGLIARHTTQTPEATLMSFCDAIVDGECFMMNVGKEENYYSVFKPDFFRASFTGVPFGIPDVYIAQFNRAYTLHFPEKLPLAKAGKLKNQEKHLRHFLGYAFVHDTDIWPNFGPKPQPVWKIMDDAGIGNETAFYGYWNKENPVRKTAPETDRVMVSSYAAENGVLTFIMNDTDQPVKTALAMDQKLLGISPVLTDAETGNTLEKDSIDVPARDFRIIRICK